MGVCVCNVLRKTIVSKQSGSVFTQRQAPIWRPAPVVFWLASMAVVLGALSAFIGAFSPADGAAVAATTFRGDEVLLYGQGLYREDTLFAGAGSRGTDVTTLLVGLPFALGALWWARKGSPRGALLLVGALGYFLYVAATAAFAVSYNSLHLLYIVSFSASFFALVTLMTRFNVSVLEVYMAPHFPRRWVAAALAFMGIGTAVAWLPAPLLALQAGELPPLLGVYTTMVTNVLDLGLIVPAALLAAYFLWTRQPMGILISALLLGIVVMLVPLMTAQTIYQLRAGVSFTTAEIVAILGVFTVMSLMGLLALIALLRGMQDRPAAALPVPSAAHSKELRSTPAAR
jgi:hypothetical protein